MFKCQGSQTQLCEIELHFLTWQLQKHFTHTVYLYVIDLQLNILLDHRIILGKYCSSEMNSKVLQMRSLSLRLSKYCGQKCILSVSSFSFMTSVKRQEQLMIPHTRSKHKKLMAGNINHSSCRYRVSERVSVNVGCLICR